MNRFRKIFLLITVVVFFIGIISPIFVFAAEPPKTTAVYFCPQIDIPFIDMFDTKKYSCKEKDKEGNYTPAFKINTSSIAELAAGAYKFIAGIAGIAAVIVMMAGGYVWLFAGGNASKVGEAKSLIGSAVLGLFLVLGSYMILNLINPELIKLKSLDDITGIDPMAVETLKTNAICTPGQEKEAINKKMSTPGCGTIYKYDKGSCMRANCDLGQICELISDSDGQLFSGGCISSVTGKVWDSTNKKYLSDRTFNAVNPGDCGNVTTSPKDTVGSVCDKTKGYCVLINGPFTPNTSISISASGATIFGAYQKGWIKLQCSDKIDLVKQKVDLAGSVEDGTLIFTY